ncbi:MAG: SDR family NAD(P)-dependent oxidoreductase [Rubrivivax sp.]|nr:SDR family NAD(P)-dependent oxidoreductase [Rubrivivax sp.]
MELSGLQVAVTGATGFIGRYLCAALHRRGARVIGVARNPERVPRLGEHCAEMRQADLADAAALARGFAGADVVVSNAALFRLDNSNWRELEQTNIQGGRNVMQAAARAGVQRLLLMSSCGVYASMGRDTPSESGVLFGPHSRRLRFNHYMISKALAERDAWDLAGQLDIAMTAIRPSAVYGAHDTNFMPRLLRAARQPVSFPFIRFSLVYAGDVAEALCDSIANDRSIGKAYNTAGDDLALDRFVDALRTAYAIRLPPRWRLPVPLPFRNTFDSTLARRELGFANRSYAEGLADTRRLEGQ